jgi:hypothetical protein
MMQNCLTACGTSRLRPQTLAELPKRRIAGIQSDRLFEHKPGRATASDNDGNHSGLYRTRLQGWLAAGILRRFFVANPRQLE